MSFTTGSQLTVQRAPPDGVDLIAGYCKKSVNECGFNYNLDNSVPVFGGPD